MKSIREQIKEKPKQHYSYFACLFFAILAMFIDGYDSAPFLAGAFVIAAIIDDA